MSDTVYKDKVVEPPPKKRGRPKKEKPVEEPKAVYLCRQGHETEKPVDLGFGPLCGRCMDIEYRVRPRS